LRRRDVFLRLGGAQARLLGWSSQTTAVGSSRLAALSATLLRRACLFQGRVSNGLSTRLHREERLRRGWNWRQDAGCRTDTFRADEPSAAPIHAIVDAVTARALAGPTELTTDELATLVPKPPDPKTLAFAQQMLRKVGITWPGSPEFPEEPT
jgi:hypothetical protein